MTESTEASVSSPQPAWTDRLARAWLEHDGLIYAGFVISCTLYSASIFYGNMLQQTRGVWSAPLDDVFIHFDYARSFARGFPFEWVEGNGFSSGNTSLTYPIVLALGYWIGFRKLLLLTWAFVVAALGVFAFLFNAGRLVDGIAAAIDPIGNRESAWMKYLIPPAVLSVGALDWTLWSGMETAWHLGVWGLCLAALERQLRAEDLRAAKRRAWLSGAAGALLIATRPESAVCVAAFGLFGAAMARRDRTATRALDLVMLLLAACVPSILVLALQAAANAALTGEVAANGAIAKLLFYQPYMTNGEKWRYYLDLLDYIVPRVLHHHIADERPWGWLVVAAALLPLASTRLRWIAVLLWAQIVGWMLLISVNMQVRWQNERYAMPATAWLLVLAAMGIGALASWGWQPSRAWLAGASRVWGRSLPVRIAGALTMIALYWIHQEPCMRDQLWFFGRACRNILDQHVTAGLVINKLGTKRVLVGDAGALIYASDKPGIDLIGLGGYHAYPFARSTLHGLGATIEQIERLPSDARPDLMAIYPTWWGDLPTHFGRYLTAVPVAGNVICGGAEKVLYRANWRALDRRGSPRALREGERVVDELDVADLTSERAHEHDLPRPGAGFVSYRVLADPAEPQRDLFDAGRILSGGNTASARMTPPRAGGRLMVRLAPDRAVLLTLTIDGRPFEAITAPATMGKWVEASVPLPSGLPDRVRVELKAEGSDAVIYHLWMVESAGSRF